MSLFVESPLVRKNLERAFRKSQDKLDWFVSLRGHGISQDFYEFILDELRLPLSLIVDDLKSGKVQASSRVREALIQNLTTLVPTHSEADRPLIQEALKFLTPLEKQDAIVSRFIVADPDSFLLTDEILELLWEKKDQVGADILERWIAQILNTVAARQKTTIVCRWLQLAWEQKHEWRAFYTPQSLDLSLELHHTYWRLLIDVDALLDTSPDDFSRNELLLSQAILCDDELWTCRLLLAAHWNVGDLRVEQVLRRIKAPYERALVSLKQAHLTLDRSLEFESLSVIHRESPSLKERVDSAARILELALQRLIVVDETQLRSLEQDHEKVFGLQFERALALRELFGDAKGQWDRLKLWWQTCPDVRVDLLDRLLEASKEAGTLEDLQRLLVSAVLEGAMESDQREFILDLLLEATSPYRLKHLRQEFIDSALKIQPLHRLLLWKRSSYDSRASLLLRLFFSERGDLQEPAAGGKRRYHLWGMAQEGALLPAMPLNSKLFQTSVYSGKPIQGQPAIEIEKLAEKVAQILGLSLKGEHRLKVRLVPELEIPFCLRLPESILELNPTRGFHGDLETMRFLIFGGLQALSDFQDGLFEPGALADRFFRGGLLSGVPMATILRFMTELETRLREIPEAQWKSFSPSELLRHLPTLRSFLILFLSKEYDELVHKCGIVIR